MTALPRVTMQQDRQDRLEELYRTDDRYDPGHPMHGLYTGLEVMARWREGCLAARLPIDYGWRPCMARRARAYLAEGNHEAALRELEALEIFLNPWHNKPWPV